MKIILTTLIYFAVTLYCNHSIAQSKPPRSAYDTPSSSATNNNQTEKKKSTAPASQNKAVKANTNEPQVQVANNLPVEVIDDSKENGLFGGSKESLRKDNILEDDMDDDKATPLPYTAIYSSDALYRVRVWRNIDARTQRNATYFYNRAIDGDDNSRLINIMLKAIKEDSVQAFSNIDDRFTTPISFDEALSSFGGGKDTSAKYDMEGNVAGYQIRSRMVSADSVYKFRIKEEWVFNKRDGKTYVRILGIAPLSSYTTSDGYTMENSEHALFWIYYPDLRKTLVRNTITNPLDVGGKITWEQVFENRLFESTITKSSLDADNGFKNTPLTYDQSQTIQEQLNSLSKKMWEK